MLHSLLPDFLAHPSPQGLVAATCGALLGPADRAELSPTERELLTATPAPDTRIVASIAEEIRAGAEPLGDLFCAIRTPADRRDRGQFYTPPAIVTAMTDWALGHQPLRVVDAGCGSGRRTVASPTVGLVGTAHTRRPGDDRETRGPRSRDVLGRGRGDRPGAPDDPAVRRDATG